MILMQILLRCGGAVEGYAHHRIKKMVLQGHQTTMMFPYMQKYCTGNECMSYERKTICTALCSLSSADGD